MRVDKNGIIRTKLDSDYQDDGMDYSVMYNW